MRLWYKCAGSTDARGENHFEPEYKDYQTQKSKKREFMVITVA